MEQHDVGTKEDLVILKSSKLNIEILFSICYNVGRQE
jgi:hypothetical protein